MTESIPKKGPENCSRLTLGLEERAYPFIPYWTGMVRESTVHFTNPELQPVTIDPTTEYQVEKILKRRVRNKRKEVLVRWLHWPKKYNSWIPEADVKDYN